MQNYIGKPNFQPCNYIVDIESYQILLQVLSVDSKSNFPVSLYTKRLKEMGFKADANKGGARTVVFSDCPKKIAETMFRVILELHYSKKENR